jgi:hypothetical protein
MAKNSMRFDEVNDFLRDGGSIDDVIISMEPSTSPIWSLAGIEDGNFGQTTLLDEEDCWN